MNTFFVYILICPIAIIKTYLILKCAVLYLKFKFNWVSCILLGKPCDLWLPRGGKDWEFGISRCKLLHMVWINNEVLLYRTQNYIQYLVINYNGTEYEKEYR